jgi:hypothetical protein
MILETIVGLQTIALGILAWQLHVLRIDVELELTTYLKTQVAESHAREDKMAETFQKWITNLPPTNVTPVLPATAPKTVKVNDRRETSLVPPSALGWSAYQTRKNTIQNQSLVEKLNGNKE